MEIDKTLRFSRSDWDTEKYLQETRQFVEEFTELMKNDPEETLRQASPSLTRCGLMDENGRLRQNLITWPPQLGM